MAKNEKQEWITTKIPKNIADEIEILLKNRKLGYNSKTGFITDSIREKIDELGGKSKKQQTKLDDKIENMEMELIKIQKMLIEALSIKSEKLTKEKYQLLQLNQKALLNKLSRLTIEMAKKVNPQRTKEIKKEIEELNKDHALLELELKQYPEYQNQIEKALEKEQKTKIKNTKEIQKLVGSEYVSYSQEKTLKKNENKHKEFDQTLNEILGGVDDSILEQIKNQIKDLNNPKPKIKN